jgi:phosphonate metabolism-associated iron-containing alcohol dehydrogenase
MRNTDWTHHNPVRVHAGPGAISQLPSLVPKSGNILLVTTCGFVKRGVATRIEEMLGVERVCTFSDVTPNPDLDDLDRATEQYSGASIAVIVALGGGSVLDVAKVLSVTLPCGFSQPLQQIFRDKIRLRWGGNLPVIAIPTTSGTGAEVTPFATVWDGINHKKYSLTGGNIYPHTALLDPELTLTLPAKETLYTALDTISHALESLWNKNRTPVSEGYAMSALTMSAKALHRVMENPSDIEARTKMQQASFLAGLAISQTRTAIAHSISYPLTIHFGVPHGLACSFTLANVIQLYLEQNPGSEFSALMCDWADLLTKLDLFSHLHNFVSAEQILSLQDEMISPGRADNFDGIIESLVPIIST